MDVFCKNGLMCFDGWLMFEKTIIKKGFHLPGNEGTKVQRWKCVKYD